MKSLIAAWAPDVFMCAGACTVAVGVGMVYVPAGVIVGGVFALAGGWLLARGAD